MLCMPGMYCMDPCTLMVRSGFCCLYAWVSIFFMRRLNAAIQRSDLTKSQWALRTASEAVMLPLLSCRQLLIEPLSYGVGAERHHVRAHGWVLQVARVLVRHAVHMLQAAVRRQVRARHLTVHGRDLPGRQVARHVVAVGGGAMGPLGTLPWGHHVVQGC